MDLDGAWNWYVTTRLQFRWFGRLGRKHWDGLPWDGPLGRDHVLKEIDSGRIVSGSEFCLEHLDDFAVLILFSVFELIVRDRVIADLATAKERLGHDLIIRIVEEALERFEDGSFSKVLEVFKAEDAGLVEEVNQVRRYRNWVAHGRRGVAEAAVDPETAYTRLKRFLLAIAS